MLSDVHVRRMFTLAKCATFSFRLQIGPTVTRLRVEEIVRLTNTLNVDLVAIAGDLFDGKIEYLRKKAEPLADLRSKHGTFYVTG